jgi:hypothetical protein
VTTAADVRRLADANRQISRLASSDVRRLWSTLDTDRPLEVREALEELLPGLVETYGDLSATVAADWYDEQRAQAGVRGSFTALLAAPFAAEAVRANARWAIGPLFSADPEPDRALALLTLETDRMVRQPGRDTRTLSASRDPARPRYARVPTSPKPCAFCTMLASRGAVYHSESAAGGGFNSYHADCACEVIPVHTGQPLPEGYDPDGLYDIYEAAAVQAGPGAPPKRILAEMRQMQGIN